MFHLFYINAVEPRWGPLVRVRRRHVKINYVAENHRGKRRKQ